MKREELTALGLEGDMLEKVMALHGKDVEKHKAQTAEAQRRAEEAKAQLDAAQYRTAAEKAAANIKFSSKSAKQAFEAALSKAELPLENGEITGFDEFLNKYKADDEAAFMPQNAQQAVLMRPTGSQSPDDIQSAALRAAFGLQ